MRGSVFLALYLQPSRHLPQAMQPRLAKISKQIVADPRPNGGSMFRIYRDVRFSKDKKPYKDHAGIHFRHQQGKSAHAPGFSPSPPRSPSFAPALASLAPRTPRARASRAEAALIGLAALLGLLVVLQRNGTLAALFASAGQVAAYERLERALGGPGFGTPRAVDALIAKTPPRRGL